ncbi:hypothetical protein EFD56_21210 [Rhizobium phaseoli]|uniref:nucleoid-associated protein n=1 Tax=Rhizobium phaseoli TaxID=396 RepID=UPI000F89B3D6|nr:nucleoid-associated protein [Rhizobium phaseoli]RUM16839.1 hypothetical protein EFD56_21210 [Rhizobium phaseoli]
MAFYTEDQLGAMKIERMVFHLVGTGNVVKLEELDAGDFEEFFIDRIRSVNAGLPYKFNDASKTLTRLRRIIANGDQFQEESEKLADDFEELHDGNTSKGAILLFVLKAGEDQSFALLKYDDEMVVAYDLKDGADGRKRVSLESIQRTFVQNKTALQKAALITVDDNGGDLTVLDRRNQQKVARYFERFLDAKPTHSDGDLTKKLVDVTRKVVLANPELVEPYVLRDLTKRSYDAASAGGSIEIDGHRNFLEAVVGKKLPDDSVLLGKFHRALHTERIDGVPMRLSTEKISGDRTLVYKTEQGIDIRIPAILSELVEEREDCIVIHDKLKRKLDEPK